MLVHYKRRDVWEACNEIFKTLLDNGISKLLIFVTIAPFIGATMNDLPEIETAL